MSASYRPSRIVGTYVSHFGLLPRERADLISNGVAETSIDMPTPIRGGHVVFGADGRFDFEQHCSSLTVRTSRAFLFLVCDMHDEPEDIVAWQPALNRVASWRGLAWSIGQSEAYAVRLDKHEGLLVHRDPLSWLQAGRRGVFLLRPRLAAAWLSDAGPLVAEDAAHGVELRRVLTRPAPRIIVPASEIRRAA